MELGICLQSYLLLLHFEQNKFAFFEVYRNVEFNVHLYFDKFCVYIRLLLGNSSKSATSVFLALFFFQILKYWFYKWKCVHKIITVKQNEDDDDNDDDADDDNTKKKSFAQRNMHRIFIIWKLNIAQWIYMLNFLLLCMCSFCVV